MSDHDQGSAHAENSPEQLATDRTVHGLLSFVHSSSDNKESRIQRVLDQIDQPESSLSVRRSRRFVRFAPLASAAMLMLVAIAVFVVSPQPSAYAIVTQAIDATRSTDRLRYEVYGVSRDDRNNEMLIGTIDMHNGLSLVRLNTPHGHEFVMGRDAQGEWSIRLDGSIDRRSPREAAPRWINIGESTILIGSVDALLVQLQDEYDIKRSTIENPDATSDSSILLIAERLPQMGAPGPSIIRVLIDEQTSLVDRLELEWTRPTRAARTTGRSRDDVPPPAPDDRVPPRPHGEPPLNAFRPELLRGPPIFEDQHHPPPPQQIVFQRVDPIVLPEHAFSPAVP